MARELVLFLARCLVDHPEAVTVSERDVGDEIVVELSTHAADLGKIIGKQGRTIHALRSVVDLSGRKSGRPHELELLE